MHIVLARGSRGRRNFKFKAHFRYKTVLKVCKKKAGKKYKLVINM